MFFRKKKKEQKDLSPPKDKGLLSRLQVGLSKSASKFGSGIGSILMGQKVIDEDLLDEIEMQLLTADVGIEATSEIIDDLRDKVSRNEIQTAEKLKEIIKDKLEQIIKPTSQEWLIDDNQKPYIILVVGVNGVGKTTTIGKLAKKIKAQDKKVMLAAGDTFRAAAIEQLKEWGDRNEVDVVSQNTGADSASVIYDAVESAKSKQADVLIADTAGRLHTKDNLMEELKKVVRVIKKVDSTAPHEIMLVLDATTGQNALSQAEIFNNAVGLTGLTITKLDGTAKGGIIFSIAKKLGIPIRFIGVGEAIDDLQVFNANTFVDALFK